VVVAAPVYAPWVPTYATYTPYINSADFLAEPTGVDTSQLIPGGTPDENKAALVRVIARASSEADRICQQVLAATTDIQTGTYRVQRDDVSGLPVLGVPVKYTPLIEVSDVRVGSTVPLLTSLPDLSGIRFEQKVAWVPVPGALATYRRLYAQMTYVNGYAHTLLAAPAPAGASSITLKGALGAFPGLPMTIYDGAGTEPVAIGASYVPGSATVPLAAPLAFGHGPGVTVSALPPFVRDAVINLVASLVKVRGAEAFTMASVMEQPTHIQTTQAGGTTEYQRAKDLLAPLARVA
jgi:hypothetical protein